MNTQEYLSQVEAEIERLQHIAALLREDRLIDTPAPKRGPGRPKSTAVPTRPKRILSPEARQRIGDAQRKRHAAAKKAAAKKTPSKRTRKPKQEAPAE